MLTLDDRAHRAFVDGVELPRVTSILREAGLIEDAAWLSQAALDRGAAVHALIASLWDQPDPAVPAWPKDAPIEAVPYAAAAATWYRDSGARVLAAELPVGSLELGYAGVVDLVVRFGDSPPTIVDIKTGSMPPWVGLQTAAYARAYEHLTGATTPLDRAVLVLQATDMAEARYRYCRLDPATRPVDEAVFLSALQIATWKRRRLGKRV